MVTKLKNLKNKSIITFQPGFQEQFLSSCADIAIGGGAAGAGKTYAELLEPLRNKDNSDFGAVFFRRTIPQIKNIGGLWDESSNIYPYFNAKPNSNELSWTFPSGAKLKFFHLEHEKNIYDHQGAQYPLIIFDELTHFTKRQFFYLLSRNRSTCGVKPYVRATTNPDPDSWVADFIEWWIEQDDKSRNFGFPIPERAGKIRYFIQDKETYIWGDTKSEVIDKCGYLFENEALKNTNKEDLVKSATFIPGNIYQNRKLLEKDPTYLSNLLSQDEAERARLLEGNWKIRTDGLSLFNHNSINDLFTNYPSSTKGRFITCDPARFGRDFTVIFVWEGYRVIKIVVITKSDANDVVSAIEKERANFKISKSNIIIDQDGVGGGVVRLGDYMGFSGDANAKMDPDTGIKENYSNLKTQCYYRLSDIVNRAEIAIEANNETVVIDGSYGIKIKVNGKLTDVKELIKSDLRAIKRKDPDKDGKRKINSKEEQKIILNGRSPDFGDTMMMRIYFDLVNYDDYAIRRRN
jgi:hypothetical protein